MDLWILFVAIAWFALGAIVAAFIYLDMKTRDTLQNIWIIIGFLLNVIGLLAYFLSVRVSRRYPYKYPPSPTYDGPQYQFGTQEKVDVPPPEIKETKGGRGSETFEFSEGIPRCPHCGAAISSHDWDCPRCDAKLRY